MEEVKKRKAFSTKEQRNEAQKKYISSEKGKEAQKKATSKSQTKKYINEYATLEELEEIEQLIMKRKNVLKNS